MGITIFDLDGTLTHKDTYRTYLTRYLAHHPVRWPTAPLLAGAVGLFALKLRSNHWLKRTFLSLILGGAKRDNLASWNEDFANYAIQYLVRRDAIAAIKARREAGDRIVLATASPDLYVTALAHRLGIKDVIATRVAWDDRGRLTGDLDGENCYGPEKRRRVEAWLAEQKIQPDHVTVYSDHQADLPLFDMADKAVAVSPTPKLAALARDRSITTEIWT